MAPTAFGFTEEYDTICDRCMGRGYFLYSFISPLPFALYCPNCDLLRIREGDKYKNDMVSNFREEDYKYYIEYEECGVSE